MPITTWDEFKERPDVQKIVVARIRPWKVLDGWTANGAATFQTGADHAYEAVEEFDTGTEIATAYVWKDTTAEVESTDASWTLDGGQLIVNPKGGAGLTGKKIRARHTLGLDTHGKIFDDAFHEPVILAVPDLTNQFSVFESRPARSEGRLVLADDPERSINFAQQVFEDILLNAECDLYLGGEALPFSEYRHFHAGVVRSWSWDGQGAQLQLSIDDRRRLLDQKIAITPGSSITYTGRVDQIYTSVLGAVGLSTSGIPDLSTDRPWPLRITLTEDTRVEDILALADRSALTYHVMDRAGVLQLKTWSAPDSGESGIKTYDEALECRNLRIEPRTDWLYTRVKVTFGSGALATRQRERERSATRHGQDVSGPWTNHGTASNLWWMSWDSEPDEVTMDGGLIPREASMAAANTNDQSWFYNDNERRLYVNPTLLTSPDTHDWRVFWHQEKSRSTASGTGFNDENVATAVSAEAEWKYGLSREWRIDSVVASATAAQALADAALALVSTPLIEASFEAVLKPLDNELGDTLRLNAARAVLRDGDPHFRIRSIQEDYVNNKIRIIAWKPCDFEA